MGIGKDYIFLSEGELHFLFTSLKTLLEDKGATTEKCDFSMEKLGALLDIPRMFIIEAKLLNKYPVERTFLYDYCIEKDSRLVIIGDSDDVNDILSAVSNKIVAASFKRPVNNQEILDKLLSILERMKYEDRKKKILVVDDSPMFLRTVHEWLEEEYAVSICPSATAAFHMIEVKRPDLILLDYEMPICSGAQFLEMLHSEAHSSTIPVIFLTSRGDKETVQTVLALKPQGYLLKTLPKEQILKSISDFFTKEKGK